MNVWYEEGCIAVWQARTGLDSENEFGASMKHLPKHLRPRWRYLAVEIEGWPDTDLDRGNFQRNLWYSAGNLLGEVASAELDLSVVRFWFETGAGEAIIRVRHEHVDPARAAIACLEAVDGQAIGLRVVGVSGTIRACEEKYMGRGRETPEQRYVAFGGAEQSASVRSSRVDVETDQAYAGATILDLE